MNCKFPIAIRSCERPFFLNATLHSLMATKLPEDCEITIFDDCSKDNNSIDYLFTNKEINVKNPILKINGKIWGKEVGNLIESKKLEGIKDKFEIIQPDKRKGDRGFIFWIVDYMMKKYPNIEAIHVVEADSLFHNDWYEVVENMYKKCKDIKGPNGNYLGLLSAYDRKGRNGNDEYGWNWRSVKKLSNGNIGCGNGIGGVHYLLTRNFYEKAIASFKKSYNPSLRSGDTSLQACCYYAKCNIAVTKPSLIQHIGTISLAWPMKGWRYTHNFKKPYSWKEIL